MSEISDVSDFSETEVNSTPRIHTITEQDLTLLKHKIHDITKTYGEYTSIYVSIGGKMNETTVQFPDIKSNTKHRSNCLTQMVPAFMQTQSLNEHPLCIILDQFNNQVNLEQNIRLLKSINDVNMDICLFHYYCNRQKLTDLMSYIINLAKNHSIPPQKLMICNFVKFLGCPNMLETASEQNIPEVVQKCLNPTPYSECFYEWFGYRFYLYNFIYNYKKYGQNYFMYRDTIKELESNILKRYADPCMVTIIQDNITSKFWDNVFDLSNPSNDSSKLAVSLKEFLVDNGQLVVTV
uniref:Uncharacterized protein n=1 Tax=viral metagenome TaxID=1070528 RepID=A0A6C0AS37_9ZZZZ